MSSTTKNRSAEVRKWVRSFLYAIPFAAAFSALVARRNPDHPFAVFLAVMFALSWPVVAGAILMLWVDKANVDAEIAGAKDDIESAWVQEAAATAFFTTIGGLLFLDGVGGALKLDWMSPVGLVHALVLGLGTFAFSYLWLRVRATR